LESPRRRHPVVRMGPEQEFGKIGGRGCNGHDSFCYSQWRANLWEF
jgi:hypothetical protein